MDNIEATVVDMNGDDVIEDDVAEEVQPSKTSALAKKKAKKAKAKAKAAAAQVPQPQPPPQPQQTLQDVNNEITKMTQSFNTDLQAIADTRARLSALQAKSLNKSLRVAKLAGDAKQTMETELNEALLEVSDIRDTLSDQQNDLIAASIKLFKLKDLFYQGVTNDLRGQIERLQKAAQPVQQPATSAPAKVSATASDKLKHMQDEMKQLKHQAQAEAQAVIDQRLAEAKMQTAESIRGMKQPKRKVPYKPPHAKTNGSSVIVTEVAEEDEDEDEEDSDDAVNSNDNINGASTSTSAIDPSELAKEKAKSQLAPEQLQLLQSLLQQAKSGGVDINTLSQA